jgi:histidinol-phosphate phosphatase family protein
VAVTARRAAAVFVDKDGTLVENVPYNVRPERVQLLPGVLDGLRALHDAGFRLVVVSNQPGVAFGYFEASALRPIEARIQALVAPAGVSFARFAWCPHHPDGVRAPYAVACGCRKPAPGLLVEAAAAERIDLAASWLIGDILDDVEAGARAGCSTVLVDRGGETEWRTGAWREPDAVVPRFDAAAQFVLQAGRTGERLRTTPGASGIRAP